MVATIHNILCSLCRRFGVNTVEAGQTLCSIETRFFEAIVDILNALATGSGHFESDIEYVNDPFSDDDDDDDDEQELDTAEDERSSDAVVQVQLGATEPAAGSAS